MKSNPLRLYLTYSFVTSALYSLIFTVNLLYYILIAKLDPLQLVLVGTALEASVFLFEVPTGVLADSYSRRLSVIIGVFLIGVAFLINGIWPIFWVIVLAQVVWGLGHTFTSGAQQAWISDEIGEENSGSAFIQSARWDQWGGVTGIILSVGISFFSLRAPILVGGFLFLVLGVYLALCMPETGFHPAPRNSQTRIQQLAATLKGGLSMVKQRPALVGILAVGFFFGFYSEGYDRLWQAHLLERFDLPVIPWVENLKMGGELTIVLWYAALKIVMMLLTVAATHLVERQLYRPKMDALIRGLFVLSGLLTVCLAGFAIAENLFLAVILVALIGVIREVTYPVYNTWVNHRLDPQVRATVLSMSSQVDAVGQIAGGPVVGFIAKGVSITAGLLTSSALLTPILVLLFGQRKSTEDVSIKEDSS
jgi:DHA3 family tetracycline resistance protein-like MFS transporter